MDPESKQFGNGNGALPQDMDLQGMKTTKTQPKSDHNTGLNGTISPNQIYPQGGWKDQNGTGDLNYLPTDPFLSEMRMENGKNAKSFKVVHKGRGHDPNKSPADCPACGQEIAGHLNQIFSTTDDNGQLRHGDVMVVTPKNRRLGNASGVIRGLRQASVPVRVQRKKSRWPCSSNQEETDNQVLVVDTDRSEEHPAERRVVVCVQSKKTASSAKDFEALVDSYAASAAIVIVVAIAMSHTHYADEACCEGCCDCAVNDCCGGRTHYSHYDGWQYAGGDHCCNCDCDCAACSGCGDCGGCGGCGGCGDCGGCECGDCDCGGCDCSGCDGCVIS